MEPMIHISSCKFMKERQSDQCLFANIYYSILTQEPDEGSAVTRSNLTHDFFLWVFKPTVELNTEQNLQPPQEKGKSGASLFSVKRRNTRISKHTDANQAPLSFMAETWFLLFMLEPQTQRN